MADYLYQSDIDNYGPELIDVTQRAALQAVTPHIQQLNQQNAQLQQRLAVEQRRRLDDQVARGVPDYQEVDRDPRWHRWLLGIDSLSGRVRQHLLNDAIAAGDPHRVKSFFDGFRREAGSTPAAASIRAGSSGKPIYTRAQIQKLYDRHLRGAYNGREAEWNRIEADIIAAGREGRVRNVMDVFGK